MVNRNVTEIIVILFSSFSPMLLILVLPESSFSTSFRNSYPVQFYNQGHQKKPVLRVPSRRLTEDETHLHGSFCESI